jgi:hypothetical protein
MLTEAGIDLNENLLSAWDCVATGALELSRSAGLVCNIVICDWFTRIAMCRNGVVVDTASFDVGGFTLSIDSDNRISAISDSGETFLDATAKKIVVGDLLEEDMPLTLANLLGEVVIQLVARKRAPQLSERMLNTEPLVVRPTIDKFVVSCCARDSRMTQLVRQGIIESIEEREYAWVQAHCPADTELVGNLNRVPLALYEPVNDIPQMHMVPVILLDPLDDKRQMEERKRRHSLSRSAPYAVLAAGRIQLHMGTRIIDLTDAPDDRTFLGNWYINIDTASQTQTLELVEVNIGGIKYGVAH